MSEPVPNLDEQDQWLAEQERDHLEMVASIRETGDWARRVLAEGAWASTGPEDEGGGGHGR